MMILRRCDNAGEGCYSFSARLSDGWKNCVSSGVFAGHVAATSAAMIAGFGLGYYLYDAVDDAEDKTGVIALSFAAESAIYFSAYYVASRVFRLFSSYYDDVVNGPAVSEPAVAYRRGYDMGLRLAEEGRGYNRGRYMNLPQGESGEDSGVEDAYVFIDRIGARRNSEHESVISSDEEERGSDVAVKELQYFAVVKMFNEKNVKLSSALKDPSKKDAMKPSGLNSVVEKVVQGSIVKNEQLSAQSAQSCHKSEEAPSAKLAALKMQMISVCDKCSQQVL